MWLKVKVEQSENGAVSLWRRVMEIDFQRFEDLRRYEAF